MIDLNVVVRVHLTPDGKKVLADFGKQDQVPPEGEPFETSLFELMVIFGRHHAVHRQHRDGRLTPGSPALFVNNAINLAG